jgi:phage terminase small subunit
MAKDLTHKQEKFVEKFIETRVGAEAARHAYDIPEGNNQLAAVIAHENLSKPEIKKALTDLVKDEDVLGEAYDKLLKAVRLDYFVVCLS